MQQQKRAALKVYNAIHHDLATTGLCTILISGMQFAKGPVRRELLRRDLRFLIGDLAMLARTIFRSIVGAAISACVVISAAQAAPITSTSFGIGGAFNPSMGTHLGDTNSIFVGNGGSITVMSSAVGDLSGVVTLGMNGTMQDIPSFSSFTPIDNFFSIGGGAGVSFDLNTFTVHSQSGPIPGFINASGTGVLSAPGFSDTSASISLTGTSVDNVSFALGVTATASTPPAPIPEPFSLGLLGVGLLCTAAASRRKVLALKA
jgi:hypothetical protein